MRAKQMSNEMPSLRAWLKQGDFTLALSPGFFSFFAHTGLLLALEENDLIPTIISGASAGAMAGGFWASGCSAKTMSDHLFQLKRDHFWDPGFGIGYLKGALVRRYIDEIAEVEKIEDCRITLKITAFDVLSRSNHIFEHGPLPKIMYASCAVPLLFQPIRIGAGLYFDGGIGDKFGTAGVTDNSRIFCHYISSKGSNGTSASHATVKDNMIIFNVPKLPRPNPFRLEQGRAAFYRIYDEFNRALDSPIKKPH